MYQERLLADTALPVSQFHVPTKLSDRRYHQHNGDEPETLGNSFLKALLETRVHRYF